MRTWRDVRLNKLPADRTTACTFKLRGTTKKWGFSLEDLNGKYKCLAPFGTFKISLQMDMRLLSRRYSVDEKIMYIP